MKTILFTLFAFAGLSLNAQSFTGMSYNCYPVSFSNTETDYRLTCDLEVCITQDIECPACEYTGPGEVTRETHCFTIDNTFNNLSTVCFWEPGVRIIDCDPCYVTYTTITIKRISTGETITVPSGSIATFLGLLNGTITNVSLALPSFYYDCQNHYYVNYLAFEQSGTNPPYISNVHF